MGEIQILAGIGCAEIIDQHIDTACILYHIFDH